MKEEVKDLIEKTGLSAGDIARILRVTRATVYNWIHGTFEPSPLAKEKLLRLIRKIEKQRQG